MTIAQEEIFGPVLTVIPYDDDEHAIAISNSTVYGLSGAVFCGDPERGMRIAQGVRSGTFQINSTGSLLDGPFGGMKQSGIGRESGLEGIEEFCEIRQIQFPTGAVAPVAS